MQYQLPMSRFRIAILGVFLIYSAGNIEKATAQAGKFLQIWGGPQYVAVENDNNYSLAQISSNQLNVVQTYRTGFGIDYIDNFNQNYGFQTGVYYCGQGQKYNGTSVPDIDTHYKDTVNFTSKLLLDYIKVPVYIRFNSVLPEDARVNVSIFFGFYLGYLLDAKSYTNATGIPGGIPDTLLAKYPNFKIRNLFNSFDFGLGAGAQFNVKLNKDLYADLGVRFDRSITQIENLNYALPDDAPAEWNYPVSPVKSQRTAHLTAVTDPPSNNISLNVYLGLTFKVKYIAEKKPVIRDDQENQ